MRFLFCARFPLESIDTLFKKPKSHKKAVQKYNGKKLLETKLGFWYNVHKYNGKITLRDKLGF